MIILVVANGPTKVRVLQYFSVRKGTGFEGRGGSGNDSHPQPGRVMISLRKPATCLGAGGSGG